MDRMIYVGMAGARQSMEQQASVAGNMANVSTPGFRAQISNFRAVPVTGEELPTRTLVVTSTPGADFRTGPMTETGRALDVAIRGDGWLVVQAADGREAYTRVGNLQVGASGQLLTMDTRAVVGEAGALVVPPGSRLSIASDGAVTAWGPGGAPTDSSAVGRLKLVKPATADLVRGDDGLFRMREGVAAARADATVTLVTGAIEGSNVNPVDAMVDMIANARRFEMQMKTVQTAESNEQAADKLLSSNG